MERGGGWRGWHQQRHGTQGHRVHQARETNRERERERATKLIELIIFHFQTCKNIANIQVLCGRDNPIRSFKDGKHSLPLRLLLSRKPHFVAHLVLHVSKNVVSLSLRTLRPLATGSDNTAPPRSGGIGLARRRW